jgi:HAD superfamily phosphoserine phosphatase-like hydrolase
MKPKIVHGGLISASGPAILHGSSSSQAGPQSAPRWRYLVASDFDKTLSLEDSGALLSEMLGIPGFEAKVAALSARNLVQQGGELAYLLLHDAHFRGVRRDHLLEVGRRIRLKDNLRLLQSMLATAAEGHDLCFRVLSAAPEEIIRAALEGLVEEAHIHGTRFRYSADGAIEGLDHVTAGHGKVAVLDRIQAELAVSDDRIIYLGDGSSDVHVMLHVNRRNGYTVAVSDTKSVAQIARRTVLGDDALGVLVPILEDIFGWTSPRIRALFEQQHLLIQGWAKVQTDWITIGTGTSPVAAAPPLGLASGSSRL